MRLEPDRGGEEDSSRGYGLRFDSSFQLHRLFFVGLTLDFLGSLAFFIWLMKEDRKIGIPQEGTAMAAFIAWVSTTIGLLSGPLFRWSDQAAIGVGGK